MRFIQFLHTGDYDEADEPSIEQDDSVDTCLEKLAISGKTLLFRQYWGPGELTLSGTDMIYDSEVQADEPEVMDTKFRDQLLEHIRLDTIGDYYGLNELSYIAISKLQGLLSEPDADSATFFDVAPLKFDKAMALPDAIKEAGENSVDFRAMEVLSDSAALNIQALAIVSSFENLDVVSSFAISVFRKMAFQLHQMQHKED